MTSEPRRPPQFAIVHPAARRLADIRSLQADFGHVAVACQWLLDHPDDHHPDSEEHQLLVRSMWQSAVISYGRGFESGTAHVDRSKRRLEIPTSYIDGLPEEQRLTHKELLDARNKAVGHRADLSQQARVTVVLTEPPAEPGVASVASWLIDRFVPFPEELMRVMHLAATIATALEAAAEREVAKLRSVVMSDVDKAYRLAAEAESQQADG